MAAVFDSGTKDSACVSTNNNSTCKRLPKPIYRRKELPVHLSVATELVIGDPENPAYRELYAEKHWTDTSNATRCQFFQQRIIEFRKRTNQPENQGRPEPGVTFTRRNAVRIRRKDYNIVPKESFVYPDDPWLLQDDPQGTELMRLGLIPAKTVEKSEITETTSSSSLKPGLKRRIISSFKRQKKAKNVDLRDEFYFDAEELKQKYLNGLKHRKRFPYVLTYKVSFLRRFRPKDEEEKRNRYSPMAIPDEVYARYFDPRFKNPWDYAGSPLPFWTPPDV